jgi:hypothetical protein
MKLLYIVASAWLARAHATFAALALTVNVSSPVAFAPPHLISLGWEVHWMLSALDNMTADGRVASIMSHLSPAVVRVGGISADWVRYELDNVSYPPPAGPGTPTWFSQPFNMSLGTLGRLDSLLHSAKLSFALDLNELYGRVCNQTSPTNPSDNEWCVGAWDMRNVAALLQRLHDDGAVGGTNVSLFGFELGNELSGHITTATNIDDITAMAQLLRAVWDDAPAPPPLYAPALADCSDPAALSILAALVGVASGFSYHSYPLGGTIDLSKLLNASWLRTGVIPVGGSERCIAAWDAAGGPRSHGLQLWITEAASSYSWQLPPPAQNSVADGYFTLAQYGQYARTGVGIVARWSFNEPNAFATVVQNGTRWDVAADYWLLVAMKALLGPGVLAVAGDAGSDIVAYAQCVLMGVTRRQGSSNSSSSGGTSAADAGGWWRWDLSQVEHPFAGTHPNPSTGAAGMHAQVTAGNGSVVFFYANPSLVRVNVSLTALTSAGGFPLTATPRIDWVFSSPGGDDDLVALAPVLNAFADGGAVLRIAEDGSLPPMPGFYVGAGGSATLSLPPRSQGFSVLLEAAAPACM